MPSQRAVPRTLYHIQPEADMHRRIGRILALMLPTILLLLTGRTPARAQFEIVAGGASCREAAYKGVQEMNGTNCSGAAGAIAVGVTFSQATNCSNSDVYVVRYGLNGAIT